MACLLAPMEVRDVESPKAEGRSEESVRGCWLGT